MNQQSTPPVYPFQYLQVQPPAEDEIDLLELLCRIWAGRYQILAITVLCVLLAGVYAFTAKQVWTSRAVLLKPKIEELGSYYQVLQQLNRTLGNSVSGSIELQADKVAGQVFEELVVQADSADLRSAFWKKSDYFSKQAAQVETELGKAKLLDELVEMNIVLTPADNGQNRYTQLALSAGGAEEAQKLLYEYLTLLNTNIWSRKVSELQAEIDSRAADLQQEKTSIESKALAAQKNKLDSTKSALEMAKKAGIENLNLTGYQSGNTSNSGSGDDDLLFLMGTKALDAQINNLTTKAPILPVRYFEIERQLKELAALPKPELDMKSYRYLKAPSTPLTKDKPKRALILALGGTLGFIMGVIIVLIVDVMRRSLDKNIPH